MDTRVILLIAPLLLIELGLKAVALRDLLGREQVKGTKWAWAVIILLVSLFGSIIYLTVGRDE